MPSLFLLAVLFFGLLVEPAVAVSPHIGRRFRVAVLGVEVQDPIFNKEFVTGPLVEDFGGVDELYLPVQGSSLGLRVGYDYLNRKRAGLGLGLSLWRVDFGDAAFLYDTDGAQRLIARYRGPEQTYGILDLTATYLAWASRRRALGLFGMLSLAGVYERYTLDRYRVVDDPSERLGLTSVDRSDLAIRPGLGFGLRLDLRRWLSLWAQARWLAGERYTVPAGQLPDGTAAAERHERLYTSTRSVGIGLGF